MKKNLFIKLLLVAFVALVPILTAYPALAQENPDKSVDSSEEVQTTVVDLETADQDTDESLKDIMQTTDVEANEEDQPEESEEQVDENEEADETEEAEETIEPVESNVNTALLWLSGGLFATAAGLYGFKVSKSKKSK